MDIHQRSQLWLFHVIILWKSIHYCTCDLEIPKYKRSKSSTSMTHGNDAIWRQNHLIPRGNISIFPMQTWMPKTVRFLSRNQGALSSSLTSLPKEKHQPLRMWTNLKFTKLSEKARSTVLSRSNQRYESFHTGIPWHVGYLPVIILFGDIEGGCVWQCTCILKDWSHKGN